jgi:hypothetical protein
MSMIPPNGGSEHTRLRDGNARHQVYCRTVLKLTSRYPDGIAGAALLLLRLSCALSAFPVSTALWPGADETRLATAATLLAATLATGIATRLAALVLVISLSIAFLTAHGERALLLMSAAGSTSALLLRGAGAYSIDAHRYGRSVIRLQPRSPDRGGAA